MVRKELGLILADLADLETEVECMIHILDVLEQAYDLERQKEARSCVQVFRGWTKCMKNEVAAVCDKLDRYGLEE